MLLRADEIPLELAATRRAMLEMISTAVGKLRGCLKEEAFSKLVHGKMCESILCFDRPNEMVGLTKDPVIGPAQKAIQVGWGLAKLGVPIEARHCLLLKSR